MEDFGNQESSGFELEPSERPNEPKTPNMAAPDEQKAAGEARQKAAVRTARAVKHETPYELAPRPDSPEAYEAIQPGTEWVDPEGKLRKKPYQPTSAEDYRSVPEGADWVDPSGQVRTKPVYGDLPITAQVLYNITTNPKEKKKALELLYPGRVKTEPGTDDLYVEGQEGGQDLKPRGFTKAPFAGILAQIAPVGGAVAGEIGGAALGTLGAGPIGTIPGAMAGAGAGSVIGQAFNDIFLKGLDIYERPLGEEVANLGLAGAMGAVGSGLGRIGGASAAGGKTLGGVSPSRAANIAMGVDPEGLDMAIALRAKGLETLPVSIYAPESPHIINIAEVYNKAFQTQQPIQQATEKYKEQQGRAILGKLGTDPAQIDAVGSLVNPTGKVPTVAAGELVLANTQKKLQRANSNLMKATREYEAEKTARPERLQALKQAEAESREAADEFIHASYKDIQNHIDEAFRVSKSGRDSGELWARIGAKLQATKRASNAEANNRYGAWREEYGGIPVPESVTIAEDADRFMSLLPPEMKTQFPGFIRLLSKLGGVVDEAGEVVAEPTILNLGELQDLRTMLRRLVDWRDLRSDWLNGAKKLFEDKINSVLHGGKAGAPVRASANLEDVLMGGPPPGHREGAKALDKIDSWYKTEFDIYDDQRLQAVINGLKSGEPADPRVLRDIMIKEGRTDLNKEIERIIGPNLMSGVRAADLDALMMATRTETPGVIDGKAFIDGVLDRHRSGMLDTMHKELSPKLLEQVRNLKLLDGKLDVKVLKGEKLPDVIQKVIDNVAAIRREKETNPLAMLKREVDKAKAHREAFNKQDLGFLYDTSMGAEEAIDKILSSPQFIYAAEAMFGMNSPEFKSIQQIATQRVLQGELDPTKKLKEFTPDIQHLLFGAAYDDIQVLAKEMNALMDTKGMQGAGQSIAAQQKVEHPLTNVPILRGAVKWVPGVNATARMVYSKYTELIRKITSSPSFLQWLKKGVTSDDPAVRAAAKAALKAHFRKYMGRGGATGAAVGESQYQTPNEPGGEGADVDALPHYVEGGDAPAGQPIVVGEEGPEVIVPQQDVTVLPGSGAAPNWMQGAQMQVPPSAPMNRALPGYEERDPAELAAIRQQEQTRPTAGRADISSEHIAQALVAAAAGPVAGRMAAPVGAAIRAAPKTAGALGTMLSASQAGVESKRGAESFEVALPEADPTLVKRRQEIQDEMAQKEAAYQQRANAMGKDGKGFYPTAKARQNDAEQHNAAMLQLRNRMEKVDNEISAEQTSQQRAKQAGLKAEADISAARAEAARPLVEKYPSLMALPFLGGAYSAGTAYTARTRAVQQYNQWVERLNEALVKAEKAKPRTVAGQKSIGLLGEYEAEAGAMKKGMEPDMRSKAEGAFAGGMLATELAAVPYLIDWATQKPETEAGQEARKRLTTLEGWLKTAQSGLAGITGSAIGSTVPTRTKPSMPDMARVRNTTKATQFQPKAKGISEEPDVDAMQGQIEKQLRGGGGGMGGPTRFERGMDEFEKKNELSARSQEQTIKNIQGRIRQIESDRRASAGSREEGAGYGPNAELAQLRQRLKELRE